MNPDIKKRLEFALEVSAQAERIVLKYFNQSQLTVQFKGDMSPVTVADRGAEEFLRGRILQAFPGDSLLGEEYGAVAGESGFRWILDPVDGTKPFVAGVPLFGMLIGIQHNDEYAAGICRLPAAQEVVYAQRGGGTWWAQGEQAPRQVHVLETQRLSDSLFCFTDLECWRKTEQTATLLRLSEQTRLSRGWGDCFGHVLVATGRAELMIDPLLSEWDAAALIPIIQEAGGVFMDWTGTTTATGGNGISTTPQLMAQVLELLQ